MHFQVNMPMDWLTIMKFKIYIYTFKKLVVELTGILRLSLGMVRSLTVALVHGNRPNEINQLFNQNNINYLISFFI